MDRRARNSHERRKPRPGPSSDQGFLRSVFNSAVAHHGQGRLQEAQALYLQILQRTPHHNDTLHLLGVLAYQQGQFSSALEYITRAIQRPHPKPLYYYNLGLVHQKSMNMDEAVAAYQQAITLKPDYEEALTNLGNLWREKGDLPAAVASYRDALRVKPDSSSGNNNLGVVLKELGNRSEAIRAYQTALRLNPKNVEAHCNLGMALMEMGDFDQAIQSFQSAVNLQAGYAKAHHNLGLACLAIEQHEQAISALRASAEATRNHGRPVTFRKVLSSRVKHDLEQMTYLERQGIRFPGLGVYQQTLGGLHARGQAQSGFGSNVPIDITPEESVALTPTLSRIVHYAEAPRIPSGVLNPGLDVAEIERRYHSSLPEILCVDDLLCEEAVQALRKFCWESTIWKKDYENGYIGAMLGEGFSCPLLLQIASELRRTFRGIFQEHPLLQAWAFKQDGQLKPLNIHADAAAVNVNFWITPNEANLDPATGGLIVWDKEAPKDWDFALYNSSKYKPKIMEFLRAHQAHPIVVPYRENRALIFNSDLFHESDRCEFKDDYTSRRINITFLFGHRI